MSLSKKKWWFALALTSPMILFYLKYFLLHGPGLIPTGFIAFDNVSYVAHAKEYLDQQEFSLFYSNPLSDTGQHADIYFQTQTVIYAFLLNFGIPPGMVIVLFNFIGTLLSFRVAISIYDQVIETKRFRTLSIWLFCWGGGLLAVAGAILSPFFPIATMDALDRIFFLDPGYGWWGLNFGRGHFVSAEGYYHFLFLLGVLFVLRKRWPAALLTSLILSLSHPFTGIEYLLIVCTYCVAEHFFTGRKFLPAYFTIGSVGILAFHLFYYLFFLNQYPEHRSVSEQYALNWRLRFYNIIPAYCIVAVLALTSLRLGKINIFTSQRSRLFVTWFLVAFALANHELFMKPMQPLHFTRGYVWASLFLIGLPGLHWLFTKLTNRRRWYLLAAGSALFFSDNILWLCSYLHTKAESPSTEYISPEQQLILNRLNQHTDDNTLILGRDYVVPYLATVYTKAYSWTPHPYTTPFIDKKKTAYQIFLTSGRLDASWQKRKLVFVLRKDDREEQRRAISILPSTRPLIETQHYIVLMTRPNN